ncbi:hypothetical protein K3740_03745 [Ruegeria conchae]|uniref:hypothetical protein n=1 Tax=Ruegeria conchae TaxID=981384 RepID=UPI00147D7944|nr:hypothetical protein [Ruegeria conchae]UWR03823.1 hypothetical protein K3740_03745 [Ruegeria conchae]
MPDLAAKATMYLTDGENTPASAVNRASLGLIPAHKALKAAQSGAALRDSGVLVCILT